MNAPSALAIFQPETATPILAFLAQSEREVAGASRLFEPCLDQPGSSQVGTALRVGNSCDYDAFGNLINQAGSTPNNYLFADERFDPALGLFRER